MFGRSKKRDHANAIVFYSYPKLLFCWPLIFLGVVFFFIAPPIGASGGAGPSAVASETGGTAGAGGAGETPEPLGEGDQPGEMASEEAPAAPRVPTSWWLEVLGWIYLAVVVAVLMTLGIDLERNAVVFWFVAFLAFFFLGMWLQDAQGFTFFGDIYQWFDRRDIQYDRGFGLALAVLLGIPYAVMLLWSRLQHKWRITHNEFEHYSWGRAGDSLARGAKRVRSTYPDLLELMLAGAGTLIVYSATGRSELRRIHHVPLLPWKRNKINRILEMTAVTTTRDAEIAAEVESQEEEEYAGSEGGEAELGNERL